jgi:large subunit ribosomal protein L9
MIGISVVRNGASRIGVRSGSSIKVILLDSVENWGSAGEIVSVKRGFARNFLVPRSKAAYATPENKVRFQGLLKQRATSNAVSGQAPAASLPSAEEISQFINNRSIKIFKEVNDQGLCFSSVTVGDVLSAAKSQLSLDLSIPKSAVVLSSELAAKKKGTFTVSIAGASVQIIVEAAAPKLKE